MRTFETSGYYPVSKKFLFLVFTVALFFVASCAKIAAPSPLREDYTETGEEIVSNISISGTIIEKPDSVGVQKFDEASWINLQFEGEIDTTSGGIKVMDISGREVPFDREWDLTEDMSKLVLKPGERLNYNTLYILKVSGTEIYKIKGEKMDINRNGGAGELMVDDFVFPFVTFKTDNSKGDWPDVSDDKIPPFIIPSVRFSFEGKTTDYGWTDVSLELYIFDYTWEMADTSIIVGALDSVSLNNEKFKIVEEESKEEIDIKSVDYIGNPDTANFGRVLISPAENFEPEKYYILEVFGGISDLSGNRLGKDDSVVLERKFKTFSCNHDSTECIKDTTAPVVLNWRNLGPGFEVSFSELIDPESVTDSSVYIPELKGELTLRNECGQTYLRFITSKRRGILGHTAFVTEAVEDMAGNKVKEVSHYFER